MRSVLSELNYLLSTAYLKILALFVLRTKIQTPVETAKTILKQGKSLVRFGDGELEWMDENHVANFQHGSKKLALELKKVLKRNDHKLLIGLPNSIIVQSNLTKENKKWWRKWGARHLLKINKYIYKKNFASAFFSRPYIMYKGGGYAAGVFELFKQILKDRDVIIVEGSKTRFGVGNDLLNNAKSVRRIIGPSTNAFDQKDAIEKFIYENIEPAQDKLFLLSFGPTATVLGADLFDMGFQTIDIGHADLEYEWFLNGATDKTNLPYKGVNEVQNGYVVQTLPPELSQQYEDEIIEVIK